MGIEDWELTPKEPSEKDQEDNIDKDQKDNIDKDQKESKKDEGGYNGSERRNEQRRDGEERRKSDDTWNLRDF